MSTAGYTEAPDDLGGQERRENSPAGLEPAEPLLDVDVLLTDDLARQQCKYNDSVYEHQLAETVPVTWPPRALQTIVVAV